MEAASPEPPPFLSGGGELARLIARFDWASTGLGPIDQWRDHVKAATALMLRSQVPIVMLWGERGFMVYNDAYSHFSGLRHPQLLGSEVRKGWPEVADFNDQVMTVCLAGGHLRFEDQELILHRHNRAEQVWMNLDYSPLLDLSGQPVGVMAIVVETTAKVQALRKVHSERERMAQLFQQAPSFMTMLRGSSHVIELVNPNYLKLVGHRDVIGKTVAQALPDAVEQGYLQLLDEVYASGQAHSARGARYAAQAEPGGPVNTRYLDFVFQPLRNEAGEVDGIFVEGIDVTDRVQAEMKRDCLTVLGDRLAALSTPVELAHAASEILGDALKASRVGYGSIDNATETLTVDRDWAAPGVDSLAGTTRLRDYGAFIDSLKLGEFIAIADVRLDARTAFAAEALESKSARSFVNVPIMENGRLAAVFFVNCDQVREWEAEELSLIREVGQRTRVSVERARGHIALQESEARLREVNETLEQKVEQRTAELMEIESHFRQAQKMEAIGQLTGGLAHDFNNLLGTISNSLQILKMRLTQGTTDGLERYIGMSEDSIRRAAALTHRLLAFSRRQTLDPKPIDANRLVQGMEDMIRRTMGPLIDIEVVGAGGLWFTKADASQLENSLLNLCINARDAMPEGGRLTIETANKWLDERAAGERSLPRGQYVSLCVTDTGTGMSADVIERIFDPFYTTKPLGMGTGMGLSMVYGFVRQSGGQVRVYSEVGMGTTMCLYLPRYLGPGVDEEEAPRPAPMQAGDGETILVVEDEWGIRVTIEEVLTDSGYHVLTADTGPAAMKILDSEARIDLLITDVGLPGGMNGRQVADAARIQRTGLKVLFITGYADNAAVGNGHLDPGMAVLTKPFEISVLSSRVKALLSP
ncbi:MAG: ATP-binding protein [Hydrogenophaga sp.]|jgi:PAS domain S-box-containing protein|uniref:ATP-binding protein n=1 Tax=Hydrogenophaga sp. TaxID=1904254 RepID=UPI004037199C